MAINGPVRLNTDISSRDYSNPDRDAAARAIYNAAQAGASNDDLQKFLLGEQGKKADQAAIAGMKLKPGQSAKVGDVSVNDSAEGRIAAQALKDAKKADLDADKRRTAQAGLLKKTFGGPSTEVESALSQVESGLSGLNLGTKEGDKTAVAALTRLADGKGQRMTQAQLSSMTPKTAQGDMTAMGNYWASKAESGLSSADRAAFKSLFDAHKSRLGAEIEDIGSQVKEQAPYLAPDLAKSGQLEAYTGTFGTKAKNMLGRLDKLSKDEVKQAPQNTSGGALPMAAGAAFGKLKSLLFGGGQQQPPQGAQPAQQQPAQPSAGISQLVKPQAPQGAAPQPAPAKPKRVTQNGQVYILNESTGEYE